MLSQESNNDFLTVEEVSKLLSVKPFTVRKYFREGQISGIKRGKRIYFHKSSLTEFMSETKSKPPSVLQYEVESSPDPMTKGDHRLLNIPIATVEIRLKHEIFD